MVCEEKRMNNYECTTKEYISEKESPGCVHKRVYMKLTYRK